jgi:3-dehydroquinate dehydratase-2
MSDASIIVINGPNLNLLGLREPEVYGAATLEQLEERLKEDARRLSVHVDFFQSNHEGEIIDRIHRAYLDEKTDGILINPGGLTHTSVALRDALLAVKIPFIEVHISNVHAREPFRQHSYLSDAAIGVIAGLGITGYRFGLAALVERLRSRMDLGLYLPES